MMNFVLKMKFFELKMMNVAGVPTEACDPYAHCKYPQLKNCTTPNATAARAAGAGKCDIHAARLIDHIRVLWPKMELLND